MRCPRLSTRRIMVLVLVLAVGLGLGVPAGRVALDEADHPHSWPVPMAGIQVPGWAGGMIRSKLAWTVQVSTQVRTPFWPRYWRCLAGRPWRQVPACCEPGRGEPGEICSHEHPAPRIDGPGPGPAPSVLPSVEQLVPNRLGSTPPSATSFKVL